LQILHFSAINIVYTGQFTIIGDHFVFISLFIYSFIHSFIHLTTTVRIDRQTNKQANKRKQTETTNHTTLEKERKLFTWSIQPNVWCVIAATARVSSYRVHLWRPCHRLDVTRGSDTCPNTAAGQCQRCHRV